MHALWLRADDEFTDGLRSSSDADILQRVEVGLQWSRGPQHTAPPRIIPIGKLLGGGRTGKAKLPLRWRRAKN